MFKKLIKTLAEKLIYKLSLKNLSGLLLFINDSLGRNVVANSKAVEAISHFFKNKKIDYFVEVGTFDGKFVKELQKKFTVQKITLFTVFNQLEDFENRDMVVENYALGEKETKGIIFYKENNYRESTLVKRNLHFIDAPDNQQREVKVKTFDNYYSENFDNQIIDFLSLDVNGYELNVLHGMEKSIKNIKCIRFSMNSFQIHTENHFKDYYQFLRNNNFELFEITNYHGLKHLKNYKTSLENYLNSEYLAVNRDFLVKILKQDSIEEYLLREYLV